MLTFRYYEGLQKCVGLYSENGQYSPDEIDRLDSLYKTLGQQYKWSSAVKVMQFIVVAILNFDKISCLHYHNYQLVNILLYYV